MKTRKWEFFIHMKVVMKAISLRYLVWHQNKAAYIFGTSIIPSCNKLI